MISKAGKTNSTAQKTKFIIKDFFSKCDQFPENFVTFAEKILMENFIFCALWKR